MHRGGVGFLTLAFSTGGEIGPASKTLLQRLRRRIVQGMDLGSRTLVMSTLDQNLSTLLTMQAATCIVNNSNHFLEY